MKTLCVNKYRDQYFLSSLDIMATAALQQPRSQAYLELGGILNFKSAIICTSVSFKPKSCLISYIDPFGLVKNLLHLKIHSMWQGTRELGSI